MAKIMENMSTTEMHFGRRHLDKKKKGGGINQAQISENIKPERQCKL